MITKECELFYYDSNNNKVTKKKYTKEQAEKMLESLENCSDCLDCSDCSKCSWCSWCSGCSDCSWCSDCSNCSYCSRCSGCSDCSKCSGCSKCSWCSWCLRCSGCSKCSWCSDCSGYYSNPQRITSNKIGSREKNTTVYFDENKKNIQVVCGCFQGDLAQFEERVNSTYTEISNKHRIEYNNFIKKIIDYMN